MCKIKDNHKEITGLIYMKTSPSGKSYIGQTIQEENMRWYQHIYDATTQGSHFHNTPFARAIRKYGKENFITTILEANIPIEELNQKEKYYIQQYNTVAPNGYNATNGGDGCGTHYDANYIKELWDLGFNCEEISQIISCHPTTISNYLKRMGLTQSDIRTRSNYYYKNIDIDALKQMYEKEHKSISEIAILTGFTRGVITDRLRKAGCTIRNNAWIRQQNEQNLKIKFRTRKDYSCYKLDKETNEILGEYPSLKEAALSISPEAYPNQISLVVNHKGKTAYGYKWIYVDEYNKENINDAK